MEILVLIDAQTTSGAYFLSTPKFVDGAVLCGITSNPVLRCMSLDWDKPPGFVRLVQVPDAQKNRLQTEWTLPSRCIALVTPLVADPAASAGGAAAPANPLH